MVGSTSVMKNLIFDTEHLIPYLNREANVPCMVYLKVCIIRRGQCSALALAVM